MNTDEGTCTVISDSEGDIGFAEQGRMPRNCQPVWQELYAAMAGKDVEFVSRVRGRAAARDAPRGGDVLHLTDHSASHRDPFDPARQVQQRLPEVGTVQSH